MTSKNITVHVSNNVTLGILAGANHIRVRNVLGHKGAAHTSRLGYAVSTDLVPSGDGDQSQLEEGSLVQGGS